MIFKIWSVGILLAFAAIAPLYAQSSPYAGTWQFSFNGQDSGKGNVVVDADGKITGSGVSNLAGDISVTGNVTSDGTMQLTAMPSGMVSTGAQFSGRANQTGNASGNWNNAYAGMSGQWKANRTSVD